MFNYRLYDQVLESSIDFTDFNLKECNEKPTIKLVVKNNSFHRSKKKSIYRISDQEGYYYKKNVGLFNVKNGNEIIFNPEKKIDNHIFCESFLNFPMALCMSQQGKFVLHASSVKFNNKVFLFCGKSHAGKSSTAAYLCRNGADFISEDISVLNQKNTDCFALYSHNKII